jgi:outer membrane murein-binding lipoprotein Lpp
VEKVLNDILNKLNSLEQGQQPLKQELRADIQKVESKIDKLELRIENELEARIRALFEAREVHNDRFERMESKIDDIATDVSYLVAKMAGTGKVAK